MRGSLQSHLSHHPINILSTDYTRPNEIVPVLAKTPGTRSASRKHTGNSYLTFPFLTGVHFWVVSELFTSDDPLHERKGSLRIRQLELLLVLGNTFLIRLRRNLHFFYPRVVCRCPRRSSSPCLQSYLTRCTFLGSLRAFHTQRLIKDVLQDVL